MFRIVNIFTGKLYESTGFVCMNDCMLVCEPDNTKPCTDFGENFAYTFAIVLARKSRLSFCWKEIYEIKFACFIFSSINGSTGCKEVHVRKYIKILRGQLPKW